MFVAMGPKCSRCLMFMLSGSVVFFFWNFFNCFCCDYYCDGRE